MCGWGSPPRAKTWWPTPPIRYAASPWTLIVANDITDADSGFGSDTNKVVFIDREFKVEELPLLTKYEVSQRILDRVRDLMPATF